MLVGQGEMGSTLRASAAFTLLISHNRSDLRGTLSL